MGSSRDLLLKRVHTEKQHISGMVSIVDNNQDMQMKIRIWDLPEGAYCMYAGNDEGYFKHIHDFDFKQPYINFEYKTDIKELKIAFVTDQNEKIVLISDTKKIKNAKSYLKDKDSLHKEESGKIKTESKPKPDVKTDKTAKETKKADEPEKKDPEKIPPREEEIQNKEMPDIDTDQYETQFGMQENFNIKEYERSISKFEKTYPFSNKREDYKWWKIENPVDLHELLIGTEVKIRNFFNVNVMMSFFRYGFFICGLYEETDTDKLLVFGFPSVLNTKKQPFKESVWVRNNSEKKNIPGYWLIYYDPKTRELIKWDQE